jgi:hypothetical protein
MFEEHTTPLERQILKDKERETKALNDKKKRAPVSYAWWQHDQKDTYFTVAT